MTFKERLPEELLARPLVGRRLRGRTLGDEILRETGKPAIVNCAGAFATLRDGGRVRLDGASGRVERLAPG